MNDLRPRDICAVIALVILLVCLYGGVQASHDAHSKPAPVEYVP
jgi:hypothetical protein